MHKTSGRENPDQWPRPHRKGHLPAHTLLPPLKRKTKTVRNPAGVAARITSTAVTGQHMY